MTAQPASLAFNRLRTGDETNRETSPPSDEIETQSKWQLGDTAWDAWSFYLLLVGLLGSEWYLRKRWGLV